MKVCSTCGVTAPIPSVPCQACATPAGAGALDAPERPDGTCWSRLSGQFLCRSCGFKTPINHLDTDGGLRCSKCGIEQAFDSGRWRRVLNKAHDVADVDGPSPQARSAAEIHVPRPGDWGSQLHRWVDKPREDDLKVEWSCGAGHPTCPSCGGLVQVQQDQPGQVTAICGSCGQGAVYAAAGGASALSEALVVALAEEHRLDRDVAVVHQDQSSAVAISCPVCRAPLTVTGAATETCAHCSASVQVPVEVRAAGNAQEARPLWLLFRGPSQMRRIAERQAPPPAGEAGPDLPRKQGRGGLKGLLVLGAILVVGAVVVPLLLRGDSGAGSEETSGNREAVGGGHGRVAAPEGAENLWREPPRLSMGGTMEDRDIPSRGRTYPFVVEELTAVSVTVVSDYSLSVELLRGDTRLEAGHIGGQGQLVLTAELSPGGYSVRLRPYRPESEPRGTFSVSLAARPTEY